LTALRGENDESGNLVERSFSERILARAQCRFIVSRVSEDIRSTDIRWIAMVTLSVLNKTDTQNSIRQTSDRQIYISTRELLAKTFDRFSLKFQSANTTEGNDDNMIDGVCQKTSKRFSSAAEASVFKTTSFDTEQDSLDPNAADILAQTHPTTNHREP
jgi:hypothetical protein